MKLARAVAAETGANHVAARVAINRREDFLRFLAKTAHAYAVFELGIGSFRPLTTELILNRDDDLAQFVGGCPYEASIDSSPANMTEITVGRVGNGPAAGYTAVRIRLYPMMGTPAHMVIVGAPL
jgi:hypothetical protein